MPARLLIIGLDGATFDLIEPMAAAGELPALGDLMRRGVRARLRSTVPPMTLPAWSSFLTGLDPGGHGLFDFTRREPGRYALRFASARDRSGKTFLRTLSDEGRRVASVGVPSTYPPEPLNGVMISGFDSPVTTGIDASFVHPPGLYDEILREVGPYRITDFQEMRIGPGWHDMAFRRIGETLEAKTAVVRYLLDREPWDGFMALFGEADTTCHHFWFCHDPGSPRHDPEMAKRHGGAVRSVYRKLDAVVGELIAAARGGVDGEDAHVMVVSDHGFGGSGRKTLYLNRWLESLGCLAFRPRGPGAGFTALAKKAALRLLPSKVQEAFFRRAGGAVASMVESRARFGAIEWSGTRAYSEEVNTLPGIWVNLRGREPEGTVEPGAEYEGLRDALTAALSAWTDPETGEPIVKAVHRREALYRGPHVDRAPDLVIEVNLDRGYTYTFLSSPDGSPGPPVRTIGPGEHAGAKGLGMNGSHRPEGIFLLAGPGIRSGVVLEDASITDCAPTGLHLLGLPVPVGLDGRVLEEAVEPEVLMTRPVVYRREAREGPGAGAPGMPASGDGLSPEEEGEIRDRLRRLGYLE